jgi:hypothetical protein
MDLLLFETLLKDASTPIVVFLTLVYFSYKWFSNLMNRFNSFEKQCEEHKKVGEIRLLKIEQELSNKKLEDTNNLLLEIIALLQKHK